jgi:hypothetical protein
MTMRAEISHDGRMLTVSLPLRVRKTSGRKRVIVPDGGAPAWTRPSGAVDSTLLKALARAHRWKKLLESGCYASVAELAAAERINASYLARVLRLTLLSPQIVAAILEGEHANFVTVHQLFRVRSVVWQEQCVSTL